MSEMGPEVGISGAKEFRVGFGAGGSRGAPIPPSLSTLFMQRTFTEHLAYQALHWRWGGKTVPAWAGRLWSQTACVVLGK